MIGNISYQIEVANLWTNHVEMRIKKTIVEAVSPFIPAADNSIFLDCQEVFHVHRNRQMDFNHKKPATVI